MNENERIEEVLAIFHGRVQGVFFRDTVRHRATHLGLKGTVKNLLDGTVELIAQGPHHKLESLIQMMQKDPGTGQVDSVSVDYRLATKSFDGFNITG